MGASHNIEDSGTVDVYTIVDDFILADVGQHVSQIEGGPADVDARKADDAAIVLGTVIVIGTRWMSHRLTEPLRDRNRGQR